MLLLKFRKKKNQAKLNSKYFFLILKWNFIKYKNNFLINVLLDISDQMKSIWKIESYNLRCKILSIQTITISEIYKGWLKYFIGWPTYSHGMWPNEVYFKHYPPSSPHTSISATVFGSHWPKKSSTVDMSSYKFFSPLLKLKMRP